MSSYATGCGLVVMSTLFHLQLSVSFSGNSALIGPVAYISQLDFCSWRDLSEPFFDSQNILKWPFVDADGSNHNLGHPPQSNTSRTFYLQTPAVSIGVENSSYFASPGETISLQLNALDELNHPTYAVFSVGTSSSLVSEGLNINTLNAQTCSVCFQSQQPARA